MDDNVLSQFQNKRRTFYDTFANFPASAAEGDLAYATDRKQLYKMEAGSWTPISVYAGGGVAGSIPSAANLEDGSIYYETDTGLIKMVISGAWEAIGGALQVRGLYTGDGTAARRITIGFKPIFGVIIKQSVGAGVYMYPVLMGSAGSTLALYDTDHIDANTFPYRHSSDGFYVDQNDAGANTNAAIYRYVMIGDVE